MERVTLESGLSYEELAEGAGDVAEAGKIVSIRYTAWLDDGTPFDSSVARDVPFVFPLGGGYVMSGLEDGVIGMRVGGARRLIIPPTLTHARTGSDTAAPDGATLVYEIELLEIL